MTINYTTLLGLAKPVTGTETGQWGDVVNNEITSLLEDAVANAATFSVTSGNVTLSTTNGTSNQARMSTLIITGTPGTTRNVIAPSQAKVYQVINQSDSSVVIKGSATTGVTIPAGATGTVVWNGSDFVEVNSTSSGRIIKGNLQITGNLQVDGNTQLGNATSDTLAVTALVNSNLLFTDNTYDIGASGATRPRSLFLGTSLTVGSLTSTRVPYASTGGLLVDSANMTFNGTRLTVADLADSGLTSGRVVYSAAGGALTDSANLLYSGTDLTVYGLTVGRGAGAVSTNTAVGVGGPLASNTSGANNTATGNAALGSNTTGSENTATGSAALILNTSGSNNTAVGRSALLSNTTASSNTAVGYQAAYANTTGVYLTAIGANALDANTTGTRNTAVGESALTTNTTGSYNIAVGGDSLQQNSTGSYNIAIGKEALLSNTTANSNVAVGYTALNANSTGSNNTAVGHFAGGKITTSSNIFVGYLCGYEQTSGTGNTFVGNSITHGTTSNAGTGSNNTVIGNGAGYTLTSGSTNTFIGQGSGDTMTTGSKNTILGRYNGNQGGLDIRTANNYIVLSDGDGNPRAICNTDGNWILGTTGTLGSGTARLSIEGAGGVVVGIKSTGGSGNECTWQWNNATTGNNLFTTFLTETTSTARGSISYNRGSGVVAYNTTSDYRAKDIIGEVQNALATVAQLKPWMGVMKGATVERPMFVAHEAQAVAPYAVVGEKDAVKEDGTPDFQQMDHSTLVPLLTAAIQELKADLDATKAELAALKGA